VRGSAVFEINDLDTTLHSFDMGFRMVFELKNPRFVVLGLD